MKILILFPNLSYELNLYVDMSSPTSSASEHIGDIPFYQLQEFEDGSVHFDPPDDKSIVLPSPEPEKNEQYVLNNGTWLTTDLLVNGLKAQQYQRIGSTEAWSPYLIGTKPGDELGLLFSCNVLSNICFLDVCFNGVLRKHLAYHTNRETGCIYILDAVIDHFWVISASQGTARLAKVKLNRRKKVKGSAPLIIEIYVSITQDEGFHDAPGVDPNNAEFDFNTRNSERLPAVDVAFDENGGLEAPCALQRCGLGPRMGSNWKLRPNLRPGKGRASPAFTFHVHPHGQLFAYKLGLFANERERLH